MEFTNAAHQKSIRLAWWGWLLVQWIHHQFVKHIRIRAFYANLSDYSNVRKKWKIMKTLFSELLPNHDIWPKLLKYARSDEMDISNVKHTSYMQYENDISYDHKLIHFISKKNSLLFVQRHLRSDQPLDVYHLILVYPQPSQWWNRYCKQVLLQSPIDIFNLHIQPS